MAAWVRCRDRDTGHEYDLASTDPRVRDGRVIVLEHYPSNLRNAARRAKHRVRKDGKRVSARPTLTEELDKHG